ncbi:MAG: cupin domain-containing protein [Deltaproteobacteria bacterium]|nr:cupin domain-containing protein [Deltaproteobacteria bacterium]
MTKCVEIVSWEHQYLPEETRLREQLSNEGYSVFLWADSAGTSYPPHRHEVDESIWVLNGEISFGIGGKEYALKSGDRLILPAGTEHTASIPGSEKCFYLVGQKNE